MPWLSRWVNPDPIGISDGLNVFEYVASNPLRYIHPQGTCQQATVSIGARRTGKQDSASTSTQSPDFDEKKGTSVSSHPSSVSLASMASDMSEKTSSSISPPPSEGSSPASPTPSAQRTAGVNPSLLQAFRDFSTLIDMGEVVGMGGFAVQIHGGPRQDTLDVDFALGPNAYAKWEQLKKEDKQIDKDARRLGKIDDHNAFKTNYGSWVKYDVVPIGKSFVPRLVNVHDIAGGGVVASMADLAAAKIKAYMGREGEDREKKKVNDMVDLKYLIAQIGTLQEGFDERCVSDNTKWEFN
jgi:uncharacterized protein RhaS with RHS repeats